MLRVFTVAPARLANMAIFAKRAQRCVNIYSPEEKLTKFQHNDIVLSGGKGYIVYITLKARCGMSNRSRLFSLIMFFKTNTDEQHTVSLTELMDSFARQGDPVSRKTLREDVALLQALGMDIVAERGTQNHYYLRNRQFTMPELKLLCDAVSSSQFISQSSSRILIDKLSSDASQYQKQELRRQIYPSIRVRQNDGRHLLQVVETITQAINTRKQISFRYADYNAAKRRVLRHGGEEYVVSPYAMVWNSERYYLICHSAKREKILPFRIDRMLHVTCLDTPAVLRPKNFRISEYTGRMFKMFDGTVTHVSLECEETAMNSLIDHFGEGVDTQQTGEHTFRAEVDVCLSPTFYAWVFQFRGAVRLTAPQSAVEEYHAMLDSARSPKEGV